MKKKDAIVEALKQNKKVADIVKELGVSRAYVDKIKKKFNQSNTQSNQ